jgi:hypothetical protein
MNHITNPHAIQLQVTYMSNIEKNRYLLYNVHRLELTRMGLFLHGKLKRTPSKYEIIEKAIALLEQNGFTFCYVETDGESDSHMGVGAFQKKYNSRKEYYKMASSDYFQLSSNEIYSVSWKFSRFCLENEAKNIAIHLIICPFEPETNESGKMVTYCFFDIDSKIECDIAFANEIQQKIEFLNN